MVFDIMKEMTEIQANLAYSAQNRVNIGNIRLKLSRILPKKTYICTE